MEGAMKIIKKIAIFFTLIMIFVIAIIVLALVGYTSLAGTSIPEISIQRTFDVSQLSEWIWKIVSLLILIVFLLLLWQVKKVIMTIYEKRNYKYFLLAAYPTDYQQEENEFYNKQVNLLQRMHSAISRPYYAKILFGKMRFGMYFVSDADGIISIVYAVHKNRAKVFGTFFKQQFPNSDLFEETMIFKNYKHYRKIFSHQPLNFFDDKQEMTREMFTNMSANSCLMIDVQPEHQNVMRSQIRAYSKLKAREGGIRDKNEIDGVLQNIKSELKKRITDKEVVFNVNIIAASDERHYFSFAYDVASATRAHNELKVYRWPLYLKMIQRVPNLYYSKTYMTDKELAVIMRFPCEEEEE